MSEKLAQLEKKGGGGGSGSGTLKEYCYHLVYDNPHTDFTSADVYQNRVTINEGAYAVVDGVCYVYIDMTANQRISSTLGLVFAPASTITHKSLNTDDYSIGTYNASGGTGKFIEAFQEKEIPSGANVIAYGTLY